MKPTRKVKPIPQVVDDTPFCGCGGAEAPMRRTGVVTATMPPKHEYRCETCGDIKLLRIRPPEWHAARDQEREKERKIAEALVKRQALRDAAAEGAA